MGRKSPITVTEENLKELAQLIDSNSEIRVKLTEEREVTRIIDNLLSSRENKKGIWGKINIHQVQVDGEVCVIKIALEPIKLNHSDGKTASTPLITTKPRSNKSVKPEGLPDLIILSPAGENSQYIDTKRDEHSLINRNLLPEFNEAFDSPRRPKKPLLNKFVKLRLNVLLPVIGILSILGSFAFLLVGHFVSNAFRSLGYFIHTQYFIASISLLGFSVFTGLSYRLMGFAASDAFKSNSYMEQKISQSDSRPGPSNSSSFDL